jgi:hypothetical protein
MPANAHTSTRFATATPVDCDGYCQGEITDGYMTDRGLFLCDACHTAKVEHAFSLLRLLRRINASRDPAEALWQALSEEHATGESMGFSAATYQAERVLEKGATPKRVKRLVAKLLAMNTSSSEDVDRHGALLNAVAPEVD